MTDKSILTPKMKFDDMIDGIIYEMTRTGADFEIREMVDIVVEYIEHRRRQMRVDRDAAKAKETA
jgi:hypothetical protein